MHFFFIVRFIFRTYNDKGRCKPFGKFHKSKGEPDNPQKLYFDIDEKLESHIDDALSRAKKVVLIYNSIFVEVKLHFRLQIMRISHREILIRWGLGIFLTTDHQHRSCDPR